LIRVTIGVLVLAASAAVAGQGTAPRFEVDLFRLVNDLPSVLTVPLVVVMQAGTLAAVFVAAGLALAARRWRLARDLAASGTLAWLAAKGVKAFVRRGRPSALLHGVIVRGAAATGLGFPSGHTAVAAALATAAAPHFGRRGRRISWCGVGIVAIARMYVGAHLPLDTIGSAALGWVIAASLHLAWGAPGGQPTSRGVREALHRAGIDVNELRLLRADARGSTPFLAQDTTGLPLFVKAVGRAQRDADWLYRMWRYFAYRDAGDEPPFALPRQIVEYEALLSLLAARAAVRTPELVAISALSDGSGVLVTKRIRGESLDRIGPALGDDQLHDTWEQAGHLHAARIAHRDLRRANIVIDEDGRPWIVDFGFGQAAASDRLLAQDTAELLVSLACVVGGERAVASADDVLTRETLRAALPLMQPLAMSAATRRDLRAHPELLPDLRRRVTTVLGLDEEPPPEPLLRIRLQHLLVLVVAVLAVHVIIPQVTELHEIVDALRKTQWGWLVAAALASAFTYLMAAVGIRGAAGRPLPLGRTTLVQLASSVVNRLSPGGIGGVGVNLRYLERSGLTRAESIAAVTLTNVAGLIVHVTALATLGGIVIGTGTEPVQMPRRWGLLAAIVAATTLAGLVFWTPIGRHRLLPLIRQAVQSLLAAIRHPGQATLVFAGAAGVTAGYVLALLFSLRAFAVQPSLIHVAAAYLAAAAIGAASPTPGGLGAVEAALVSVLIRFNVASGSAIAGVLAFRLVTYWLPLLPATAAIRALHHSGAL
jgi:undecaprenyl-diphosphatase